MRSPLRNNFYSSDEPKPFALPGPNNRCDQTERRQEITFGKLAFPQIRGVHALQFDENN